MAIRKVVEIVNKAAEKPDSSRLIPCVVTIDVKNAFNSANWGLILGKLRELDFPLYIRRLIQDYLNNRSITTDTGTKGIVFPVTSGVPQGSVLGPTLWNILYDEILRVNLPKGASTYAYADDLVLVVIARKIEDVQNIANEALDKINATLKKLCLEPAPQKTEAILMTGFRKINTLNLTFCDHSVVCQKAIKYLGIWLDEKRTYGFHCKRTAEKAIRVCGNLCRLLPNIKGPKQCKRKLFASVVVATISYGLEIWEKALRFEKYTNLLNGIIRRIALRTISAYRTVSSDAAFVISGIPPIEILAAEKSLIDRGTPKKDARSQRLIMWQRKWEASSKGEWTRVLIPNVIHWVDRRHGEVNYFLTQFLSGHGSYGNYFKKFKLRLSDKCIYCKYTDTPRHTFFICPNWEKERIEINKKVGNIAPNNIISKMLSSEENWKIIAKYIEDIIKEKLKDEEIGRNMQEEDGSNSQEEPIDSEEEYMSALEELEEEMETTGKELNRNLKGT